MAKTGHGTTVTFHTTGFAPTIKNVKFGGVSVEELESKHLGTTGFETKEPGDLLKAGPVTLSIQYDMPQNVPFRIKELISIYVPKWDKTISFQGFISALGEVEFVTDQLAETDITITVADDVTGV